jgi:putative salt-induced outer membrane protein YdiY
VVFKGAAYTDLWHGIPTSTAASSGNSADTSTDSSRRISFTVRHVLNVIPLDKQIVTGEAQWEQSRRAAFFQKSVTDA